MITAIAERTTRRTAQVVLRWHIELGNVVFPKSMTAERMSENIDIFDFELSADEMEQLEALDRGERTGPTRTRSSGLDAAAPGRRVREPGAGGGVRRRPLP